MSQRIVGVIGGSGLYELEGLENVEEIRVETPFGDPSDAIIKGTLDDVTMPSIRAWMAANPVAAQALMRKNKSFGFFRVLKGEGRICLVRNDNTS